MRPRLWRQNAKRCAEPGDDAHLLESLERRGARIAALPGMLLAREITVAQPRVLVSRPNQSIEVVLTHREDNLLLPGTRVRLMIREFPCFVSSGWLLCSSCSPAEVRTTTASFPHRILVECPTP